MSITFSFNNLAKTIIRHKDVLWYRTMAQLKSESRQNYLGYVWFFIEPALLTITLYLIFGVIMAAKGGGFVVFLLLGLTIWQWFEGAINDGLMGIRSKLHIMNQVPLPKYIFPLVHIFVTSWKFICIFIVVLVFSFIFGFRPNINYLYLPLIILSQLILIVGFALPLSVAAAYYADISRVVSAALRLLFYLSGIFFSTDIIPAPLIKFFYLNPIACLIEAFRSVILSNLPPKPFLVYNALIWGVCLCALGLLICNYVDKKILKSITV